MKTLKEALVKKSQRLKRSKFTKHQLQPGYIVRFRTGELCMYVTEDFIKSIVSNINDDCFVYTKCFRNTRPEYLDWMRLSVYDDLLNRDKHENYHPTTSPGFDIIEVWPINAEQGIYTQEELLELIHNKRSVKINQ